MYTAAIIANYETCVGMSVGNIKLVNFIASTFNGIFFCRRKKTGIVHTSQLLTIFRKLFGRRKPKQKNVIIFAHKRN